MLNFNSIPNFNTYFIEVFMNELLTKKVGSGGVPYMTKKHFIVLADELAHDKFYYDSMIAYHEKYARLTEYCAKANASFNLEWFNNRLNTTYENLHRKMTKLISYTGNKC